MKLKALAVMAFFTSMTFAQDTEFNFSKEGLTDYIVTTFEGSAKDTYNLALAWVKENSKKGYKVVTAVEGEKLVIEGGKENFLCSKAGGTNVCTYATFTIEINFKDGRFKFEAIGLTEKPNNATTVVMHDLNDFSEYYNKDGSLKKYKDDVPAAYESLFNELNKSLVTFMDKKKKADGW
ncbi:hypothetical protein [Flavobacterium sedimenticola]|uniref:DUF4468 domain-containing protein n=1 Tax=Flavobacterium sedimenticola TaxID=3043286 RepID=A0ABT6XT74_9FLAO|nr:hypothetical protein [Flavobacterium sedimenticola]MDI9258002.1 hypothetical protein [Flavobacterium sedimenticola]